MIQGELEHYVCRKHLNLGDDGKLKSPIYQGLLRSTLRQHNYSLLFHALHDTINDIYVVEDMTTKDLYHCIISEFRDYKCDTENSGVDTNPKHINDSSKAHINHCIIPKDTILFDLVDGDRDMNFVGSITEPINGISLEYLTNEIASKNLIISQNIITSIFYQLLKYTYYLEKMSCSFTRFSSDYIYMSVYGNNDYISHVNNLVNKQSDSVNSNCNFLDNLDNQNGGHNKYNVNNFIGNPNHHVNNNLSTNNKISEDMSGNTSTNMEIINENVLNENPELKQDYISNGDSITTQSRDMKNIYNNVNNKHNNYQDSSISFNSPINSNQPLSVEILQSPYSDKLRVIIDIVHAVHPEILHSSPPNSLPNDGEVDHSDTSTVTIKPTSYDEENALIKIGFIILDLCIGVGRLCYGDSISDLNLLEIRNKLLYRHYSIEFINVLCQCLSNNSQRQIRLIDILNNPFFSSLSETDPKNNLRMNDDSCVDRNVNDQRPQQTSKALVQNHYIEDEILAVNKDTIIQEENEEKMMKEKRSKLILENNQIICQIVELTVRLSPKSILLTKSCINTQSIDDNPGSISDTTNYMHSFRTNIKYDCFFNKKAKDYNPKIAHLISSLIESQSKTLDLKWIDFTKVSDNYKNLLFEIISTQTQIEKLVLKCHPNDNDMRIIEHLNNITDLVICPSDIHFDGLIQLRNLTRLQKLTFYHLWGGGDSVKFDDKDISSLKYLHTLECLDISVNKITSKGVGSLKYLTRLTKLNLSWNDIGNDGVCELSGILKFISQIEELTLFSVGMTDKGLKVLLESLKFVPDIKNISLRGNNINDEAILNRVRVINNQRHTP